MDYLVGIALALIACGAANWIGLDRDRAFYPTVLMVVASYYVLFAALGGDERALFGDTVIAIGFAAIAVLAFKRQPWMVVVALFAHGVLDFFHHGVLRNAGVPAAWPAFCLGFDWAAAIILGCILHARAGSQPRSAVAQQ